MLNFAKNYKLSIVHKVNEHVHIEYWSVFVESMQEYANIRVVHNKLNYKECVKCVCFMQYNTKIHANEQKHITISQYFSECHNMSNEQQMKARKQLLNELHVMRKCSKQLKKYGV